MQTKLYDNKNMRVVPIVRDGRSVNNNSDIQDTTGANIQKNSTTREVPIHIQKGKNSNLNPFLPDYEGESKVEASLFQNQPKVQKHENNKSMKNININQKHKAEAPLATEEACFACDACTQREEKDKKESCHVM